MKGSGAQRRDGRILDLGGATPRSERRTGGGAVNNLTEAKIRNAVITIGLTVFILAVIYMVILGVYALR